MAIVVDGTSLSVREALDRAAADHRAGRLQDAERVYKDILEAEPGNGDAHHMLGILDGESGDFRRAAVSLERAVAIDPGNPNYQFNLGNAYKMLDQPNRAAASYRRAIDIAPGHAQAHNNLGAALEELGKLDEAADCYRCAIAIDDDDAGAHYNLANTLIAQGNADDAIASFRRATDLNPGDIEALNGLGFALLRHGEPDRAVPIFRRVLDIAPEQAGAHHNLGNTLGACREFEQAAAAYRRALEIDPADAASAFQLGNILADLGELEDALAAYRRVLDIEPEHIDARCHLGTTWKDLGRFDEAEAVLRETLRRQPAHAKAHTQLGLTLVAKGRIEDASEIILAPVRRYRAVGMGGIETGTNVIPNLIQDFDRVNRTKIRHDIEQISYLLDRGRIAPNYQKLLGEYQSILAAFPDGGDLRLGELSPPPSAEFKAAYNRMVYFASVGAIAAGALNPDLDFAAIEAEFFDGAPAFACIDGLLSADALAGLRRFCMESTIWFQMTFSDELGTSLTNGFSCPLLFQISNELRENLPRIFGDNQLKFCWAYKYYKNLSGLDLHADSAAISINFWITPDDANLDDTSGGLVLWDRTAPKRFFGRALDEQGEILKRVIDDSGARAFKLPYRCNRGAIFNSDVIHKTDQLHFKDGYDNRRINITMMYGEPGQ